MAACWTGCPRRAQPHPGSRDIPLGLEASPLLPPALLFVLSEAPQLALLVAGPPIRMPQCFQGCPGAIRGSTRGRGNCTVSLVGLGFAVVSQSTTRQGETPGRSSCISMCSEEVSCMRLVTISFLLPAPKDLHCQQSQREAIRDGWQHKRFHGCQA